MTQEQRQNYEKIYKLVIDLKKKYWPYKGEIDKNQAFGQVINFAQSSLRISLDPTKRNFLQEVAETIIEELSKPPEQEAPSIPANLQDFVLEMDEARAREEARREKLIAEAPRKTYNYFLNLNKKIITQNYPNLPPYAVDEVSREITKDIIDGLPAVARSDLLKREDYQKAIDKNLIAEKLKNAGLEPKANISQKLLENFSAAKKIAAEPEIIKPIKEENLKIEKAPLSEEIPPLPKEILAQINQLQETVVFPNAYIFLHPKVTAAFVKKVISAPESGLIKLAIENASLDWQQDKNWPIIKEMVTRRVFAEDYRATIDWLVGEKGFSKEDPRIQQLEDKFHELWAVQKDPQTNKDLPWVTRVKRYSYIDELLGRKRVTDPYLGYLPRLANKPIWNEKDSYGNSLHRGLNKFRFISNTSQRFMKFITGGRYESVGILIRKTIYQKAVKPILIKLGKTAAGKAVKEGAKKFSIWATTKLGLQLGIKGAAVAAAPETLGVSILISLAIDVAMFLVNMIRKGFSLIRRAWYQLSEDPEKAVISLVVGGTLLIIPTFLALGPILIPILTIIGAPLAIGGGAALLTGGFKAASVGSAATTLSVQTAATTATIGGNVVLGSVVGVGVGALIITQITTSAFLIPEGDYEGSPYIELVKNGEFSGNNETGEGQITYTVKIGAKEEILIDVNIKDSFSSYCREGNPSINQGIAETPPETLQAGDFWETKYSVNTDSSFKDCLIINNITVTAKIGSKPDESQEKTITAVIAVGNPPDECPSIWPTSFGYIGQGPGSPHTHGRQYKKEAIDIMVPNGTKVVATHRGTVVATFCDDAPGNSVAGGYIVKILGTCQGVPFTSWYMHLQSYSVKVGDEVTTNQQIGVSDSTSGGCPGATEHNTAQHLHYEFRTQPNEDSKIKMVFPYVPITVPRGCLGNCGISW